MRVPEYVTEADRIAMNEAARDYAWDAYNKGVMLAVSALRDGISNGYHPTRAELVELCHMLEAATHEPRRTD